jgi:CHAT domain-containing protein
LGLAYYFLGQYQLAIDYSQQSLTIKREIGDRKGEGNSLCNLGLASLSLGQYQKAIDYYQQSLTIKRESGDRSGEGNSLGNLGNAYCSLGQYQLAIDYHQQSLTIRREIGDRFGVGSSLGNLGLAYHSLGQYQLAIDYYRQSLNIAREIGDRLGESISLNNLGKVVLDTNQLTEAEETLYAAMEICETLRSGLINYDHKVSIFETQARTYNLLQQVLVVQSQFDTALEIAERGRTRAFVELLKTRLSATAAKDVVAQVKETSERAKPATQIAQEQNATIVEYSIVFEGIYIWVIQPNGAITFRRGNLEPLEQQDKTLKYLEEIIRKARVSIGVDERDEAGKKIECEPEYKRDRQGRYPLLHLLYQILISPIADLLPTDADAHIIFIPHYALFLVPFPALQDANNHFLIEHHTILTAPSIEVLDLTHQHQQRIGGLRQTALVVGDPIPAPKFTQDPYNLKSLPPAKEAAETIATLLQTEAIIGAKATKAFIVERMQTVRLAHISAHGLLDDFGGSGIPGAIIFAPSEADDGALNAAEILRLKLNTELVVLSACSTGKGKITGDGVIGLSRCFILAGVPSLIVSLWNMGALSAKLLMTEFYQNLAKGQDRAVALRQAMLITKDHFSQPAAWAAFTLIGETASLSLQTQTVEQRKLSMPFSSDTTPQEIIDAFFNLLETSDVFSEHPEVFDELPTQPTASTKEIATKIEEWCETRPRIKENMENELYQMGAGGTPSKPDENVAEKFNERLKENRTRLGSPPSSSSTNNNP